MVSITDGNRTITVIAPAFDGKCMNMSATVLTKNKIYSIFCVRSRHSDEVIETSHLTMMVSQETAVSKLESSRQLTQSSIPWRWS